MKDWLAYKKPDKSPVLFIRLLQSLKTVGNHNDEMQ